MIRRPPRSTLSSSSAASDVYKRQVHERARAARLLGCEPGCTEQEMRSATAQQLQAQRAVCLSLELNEPGVVDGPLDQCSVEACAACCSSMTPGWYNGTEPGAKPLCAVLRAFTSTVRAVSAEISSLCKLQHTRMLVTRLGADAARCIAQSSAGLVGIYLLEHCAGAIESHRGVSVEAAPNRLLLFRSESAWPKFTGQGPMAVLIWFVPVDSLDLSQSDASLSEKRRIGMAVREFEGALLEGTQHSELEPEQVAQIGYTVTVEGEEPARRICVEFKVAGASSAAEFDLEASEWELELGWGGCGGEQRSVAVRLPFACDSALRAKFDKGLGLLSISLSEM
eukprot:TRINITY_DN13918_c0_g1_i2.p1 TRINITY_DN13918_c0_g1~~TRINITY_DN13918_c0_g1_i2.p1  ORF type:complete len:339 (-),score=78.01 TRINITY_DN13918_c0_g1_i2:139-1155(-)